MTAERLAELEAWARAWSRCETAGARFVLELVDEVRRLRMVAAARAPRVYTEDGGIVIPEELMPGYYALAGKQPAPVPPFRGVLDGVTAADVYAVHS